MTEKRLHGYTLLETVVALAIAAVVVSITGGIVGRSWAVRERAVSHGRATSTLQRAMLRLVRDVQSAASGSLRVERGTRGGSTLELIRDAPVPIRVRYRLSDGTLHRHEASRFADPRRDPADELALLEPLAAFEVACLHDDRWQATWDGPQPPDAVRITVDLGAAGRVTTTVTPFVPSS